MLRRLSALALSAVAGLGPVRALDALQSTTVPGRAAPLCASPATAGGLALNRADGTLTACDPAGTPSVYPLLKAPPGFDSTSATLSALLGNAQARVASAAALKAVALPYARIRRDGFASPGDGGQADYTWQAANCSAADDGAQVQPTGRTGCWIADLGPVVSAGLWGARATYDDVAGTGPDSRAAINAALAYARRTGATITLNSGRYYSSGPLTLTLTTDNRFAAMRPSLRGAGLTSTRIFFGPGEYGGLTVAGQNVQGPGAEPPLNIAGLSLHKADYQGVGLDLYRMSHVAAADVGLYGWAYGLRGTDIQESMFTNVVSNGNIRGGRFAIGNFTKPNGLLFLNSKFATNSMYGLEIMDPAALAYHGGSIEGNGYGADDIAFRGGLRVLMTDADHPETNGIGSVSGAYFERNGGLGDIYLKNSVVPAALSITGNTFNRGYTNNFVWVPATISLGSPAVINTGTTHGLDIGDHVEFTVTPGGRLPDPLWDATANASKGVGYYVVARTDNTFQISETKGGPPLATSGTQSGQASYLHRQYGLNAVRLEGTGQHQWVTISGNGFGGLPRTGPAAYPPDIERPYIGIVNPGPYWHVSGANSYADAIERTDFGGKGLNFTPDTAVTAWGITTDGGGTPWRTSNTSDISRFGTGSYAVTFRAPLAHGQYHVSLTPIGPTPRICTTTAQTEVGFNFRCADLTGSAVDTQISFSVVGAGNL